MRNRLLYGLLIIAMLFTSCGNSGRRHKAEKKQASAKVQRLQQRKSTVDVELSSNTEIMPGPEIFKRYNSAVFMIFTSDGYNSFQGSGFFISSSGIAVSNYHVFKGTSIGLESIKLSSGKELKVEEIIAKNNENDFIIFKVKGNSKFNYIPIASRASTVGEKVYAIGSPRGLENTFSSGEISQKRNNNIIQISVPIDHGSSGGALINSYGEVIGITSGVRDDSGANLNFAIDIKVVRQLLKKEV